MSEDTCPICFDTISIESTSSVKKYKIKPSKMMSLDCKHQFHTNCIEEWIKTSNTCPICRSLIEKEKEKEKEKDKKETNIIELDIPPEIINHRQQEYIDIRRQPKKHKIIIISFILFILSIINFGYFYANSYKYITDFKDNINITETTNCSIVVNDIVINNDCPKLKMLDLTFLILGVIIYVLLFMYCIMIYNSDKKINLITFIIINIICGLCIALYYISDLLSQFDNINIYYASNQLFNSVIERNFIISIVVFYCCFVLYNITHFYTNSQC